MSRTNMLPTEHAALVTAIDPDAYAAGAHASGYVAMKNFRRFMIVVMAGDLGASATLDAKVVAYTDGAGGGATDVTGAAITQLTQAGSDSNKQAIINLSTDALAGTAFTHFAVVMTVGTATSDAGVVVFGFDPLYGPASASDAASVDEIKSV